MKFAALAERQILKAQAEGQFDHLAGAGKPLSGEGDGSSQAVGFRIMAEAGALPREVELRKAVEQQMQLLAATTDTEERMAQMRKLADLQLRLGIEEDARRRFYRG